MSCDAILKDGLFNTYSIKHNALLKQQVAARLTTMTKSEAEKKFAGGANFALDGFPLGADYSDADYNSWVQQVKQSLDVDTLIKNERDILVSVADPTVVNAWVQCMQMNSSGLKATLSPNGPTQISMTVTWIPGPAADMSIEIAEDVEVVGAKLVAAADALKRGAVLQAMTPVVAILERPENKEVTVALNTKHGGVVAFLPEIRPVPQPPKPVNHRLQALKSGRPCVVIFPATATGDYLGTIASGATYSLHYDPARGSYTASGYVAGVGGTQEATYGGPPPDQMKFSIWGAVFSFAPDGHVTSLGLAAPSGKPLRGQLMYT